MRSKISWKQSLEEGFVERLRPKAKHMTASKSELFFLKEDKISGRENIEKKEKKKKKVVVEF